MSYVIDFTLPPTGEMGDSARLVSWLIEPGQVFERDEVLLEIETDKSVIEIPAPNKGKVIELLAKVDAVIEINTPLARFEIEGERPATAPAAEVADSPPVDANSKGATVQPPRLSTPVVESIPVAPVAAIGSAPRTGGQQRLLATPAARNAMQANQVDPQTIDGSGPGGRITLFDVGRAAPAARAAHGSKPAIHTESINTRFGGMRLRTWEPMAASTTNVAILLIHGMFADIEAWASLALGLSRSGHRVLAVDLPVHGGSSARVEHFDQLVEAVADALEFRKGQPHVIVGHSLGSAVAARLVRRPSMAAQALVLLSPMGLGTEIEPQFLNGVMHARTNEAMGRELARLTQAGSQPSAAYMDDLRERIQARRDDFVSLQQLISWNGVQQISIKADLQAANCPVSILHGRADGIIPWQHALNAPPEAALHLIPGVGHMPQWEASALTSDVILRAVRRL